MTRYKEALDWHEQSVGDPSCLDKADRKHYDTIKQALSSMIEGGWRTIDSCPNNGDKVWIIGGIYEEPELKEADGSWWRHTKREGSVISPTHWQPLTIPAAPEGERDAN